MLLSSILQSMTSPAILWNSAAPRVCPGDAEPGSRGRRLTTHPPLHVAYSRVYQQGMGGRRRRRTIVSRHREAGWRRVRSGSYHRGVRCDAQSGGLVRNRRPPHFDRFNFPPRQTRTPIPPRGLERHGRVTFSRPHLELSPGRFQPRAPPRAGIKPAIEIAVCIRAS